MTSLNFPPILFVLREMNLSETAFVTSTETPGTFGLRWFTPSAEVALCGHATIASTAALAAHPRYAEFKAYHFNTKSGQLVSRKVARSDGSEAYELDFPATVPEEIVGALDDDSYIAPLKVAVGDHFPKLKKVWKSRFDVVIQVDLDEGEHLGDWAVDIGGFVSLRCSLYIVYKVLIAQQPVLILVLYQLKVPGRGVALTTALDPSPNDGPQAPLFHSRFFAPSTGVPEDPVCGSLHCALAPLYSKFLGKPPGTEMFATHGGPRQGGLSVVWDESKGRVFLRGQAVNMASGTMRLP